jgi:hypothetical protein
VYWVQHMFLFWNTAPAVDMRIVQQQMTVISHCLWDYPRPINGTEIGGKLNLSNSFLWWTCPSVCHPPQTLWPNYLHEIKQQVMPMITSRPHFLIPWLQPFLNGRHWTSEVGAKLAPVNMGPWCFVCWQIFTRWTTFNKTVFVKNQKYESGNWLKVKIHILFCGHKSQTVALRQMKSGTVKDSGHNYKFYLIHLVSRSF